MTALPKARQTDRAASLILRLEPRFRSETGARDENQDAATSVGMPDGVCGIVADGMGGGLDGSLFSKRTVEQVAKSIAEEGATPLRERVERAVRAAVEDVRALQQSKPHYQNSGSTLVMAAVRIHQGAAEAVIAHIGDSRAYHISANGVVRQLTRDHNYAEELIEQGTAPNEAHSHKLANRLTHSLGEPLELEDIPDLLSSVALQPGDHLLLCTDGVTRVLSSTELAAAVVGRSAQDAADIIVQRALEKKTRDNATALVIHCTAVKRQRSWLVPIVAAAVLGVVLIGTIIGVMARGGAAPAPNGSLLPPGASAAATNILSTETVPAGKPTSTVAPSLTTIPSPTSTPTPTPTPTFTPLPTRIPTRVPTRPPRPSADPAPGGEVGTGTPAATPEEPTAIPTPAPTEVPTTAVPPVQPTTAPPDSPAQPPEPTRDMNLDSFKPTPTPPVTPQPISQ